MSFFVIQLYGTGVIGTTDYKQERERPLICFIINNLYKV